MKIILTHSYFLAEDAQELKIMKPYPPLGLLYLSAFLKKNNVETAVFDTTFSTYPALITYLDSEKPEVLGIHCNLLTKFTVLKLIRYCQENDIFSILGGPDASTQIEEFLNFGADIIISGEGEETLLTVLNALQEKSQHELHGIPNVAFKNVKGEIIQNQLQASRKRLDDYPFPDRQAIDLNQYLDTWHTRHGQRPVSLVTARGCAFTCKWCSHSVYGHTHRRRTPENVVAEIKEIIAVYHPTHLWFADDVFTVNKRWLIRFNDLINSEGIRLPFECIGRADRLDEETVQVLKELGCYRIWIGAESGSQHVLDVMSRGVTLEEVLQARKWCKQYNIEFGTFIMFGYPGEELQDIYETIGFVRELQPDKYLTTVTYPLRGTALYDEFRNEIIFKGKSWKHYLQRELNIHNRFSSELYHFAARKMASDFRIRQLQLKSKQPVKRIVHRLRSIYCDFKMHQLAQIKT